MAKHDINFLELIQSFRRGEYQRRAHFAQIAYAAAGKTGLPVFMGRQSSAA